MRTRPAVLAGVVVLAACGSSSGVAAPRGAGAAAVPCGPSGAHTLAADRRSRIYTTGSEVYGCAHGTGHTYRLGSAARSIRESRVEKLALAGVDAGYGLLSYGVDTGSAQVVVRRLRDGKVLRTETAVTGTLGPESYTAVDGVVLKSDGSVAWIASGSSIVNRGPHPIEVHRADSRGQALLDSSSAISPGSLRLHGSTLSWRDGAQTKRAALD